MESSSRIIVDYKDNPDLREIFSRKELGDTCELKMRIQVNEKSLDGAEGYIESITPLGYSTQSGPPKSIKPSRSEPVMVKMMKDTPPRPGAEEVTARLPKALLGEAEFGPGDEIRVEVIRVGGDHVEVKYVGGDGESTNQKLDRQEIEDTGRSDHQRAPVRNSNMVTSYA